VLLKEKSLMCYFKISPHLCILLHFFWEISISLSPKIYTTTSALWLFFPGELSLAGFTSGPPPPVLEQNLWVLVEWVFVEWMSLLSPNHQCQSTEGK